MYGLSRCLSGAVLGGWVARRAGGTVLVCIDVDVAVANWASWDLSMTRLSYDERL